MSLNHCCQLIRIICIRKWTYIYIYMYSFQDVQTSLKFELNQQINMYMNEAYTRIAIIMSHHTE